MERLSSLLEDGLQCLTESTPIGIEIEKQDIFGRCRSKEGGRNSELQTV